MKRFLGILVALTLLGSFLQIVIMYFLPFVNMVNFGEGGTQVLGLSILLIPLFGFIIVYKFIMRVVTFLLHRKGD